MPFLRGHHLICLHFFSGEGHDEAFINNLKKTITRAETEAIIISSGSDDICGRCPYLEASKCFYAENADVAIKEMDSTALSLLDISIGDKVKWDELSERACKIFPEWFSLFCKECDWRNVCENNPIFRRLSNKL